MPMTTKSHALGNMTADPDLLWINLVLPYVGNGSARLPQ